MTAQKKAPLKYILLGGAAVVTAFAFTATADHPHKPKKAEKTKTETMVKKMKAKKPIVKMAPKEKMDAKSDTNMAEQSKDDEKWDVMNPPGDKREIDINVT